MDLDALIRQLKRNEKIFILARSPYFTRRAICRRKKFIKAPLSIIIPRVAAKRIGDELAGAKRAKNEGDKLSCRAASLVCIRDLGIPCHEHPNVRRPKRVRGIAVGDREAKCRNGTYANRFCRPECDEVS